MQLDSLVDNFLFYLTFQKNYSPLTIEAYRRDLLQFLEFAEQQNVLEIQAIDHNTGRKFIIFLEQIFKNNHRSINRKVSSLRSFWKYLQISGHCKQNPWKKLSLAKFATHLPEYLLPEEINKLLEYDFSSYKLGLRDLAIIELLFATGIRISELHSLKMHDINFHENEILVTGKGNKERIVILGNKAKKTIETYLNTLRPELAAINKSKSHYLFLNYKGTQLTQRSVQRSIKEIALKCGITKELSPHTLRHTFATELLNGGAGLRVVQELLGHASLTTTQIYTHVSKEKMKKDYQNSHPRA